MNSVPKRRVYMNDDSEDDEVMDVYKGIVNAEIAKEKNENKSKSSVNTDDDKISHLKEENKRLKDLIKKYRKESRNITFKCIDMRDKEKTSIMQTLELLKLNNYLIKNIPNSKKLLKKYISDEYRNGVQNENYLSSDDNQIDEVIDNPKVADFDVNNIDKNDDKSETNTESESELSEESNRSTQTRRSPRKAVNNGDDSERYPKRKREQIKNNTNADEESDDSNDESYGRRKKDSILGSYGRGKRGTSSAVKSTGSRRQTIEEQSDADSIQTLSPVKRVGNTSNGRQSRPSTSAKRSEKKDNRTRSTSCSTTEDVAKESKQKTKKKRVRRPREEPEIGYFPCSFDKNQCTEILQTKDAYNFHMSGHLDAKYVCPYCAYTGPTIQIIRRHITTEREDEPQSGDDSDDDRNRMHRNKKMYKCNGCNVCHKIHERDEKRCSHILNDKENECKFAHDIDHEFKDHLKEKHFNETFGKNIKNKDLRRKKIREIVDKFVDEQYFENNAKKRFIIQKYQNNNESDSTSDLSD